MFGFAVQNFLSKQFPVFSLPVSTPGRDGKDVVFFLFPPFSAMAVR